MWAHLTEVLFLIFLLSPAGLKQVVVSKGGQEVVYYYGKRGVIRVEGPARVDFIIRRKVLRGKSKSTQMVVYVDKERGFIRIPPLPMSDWRLKGSVVRLSEPHLVSLKLGEGSHILKILLPGRTFVRVIVKKERIKVAKKVRENRIAFDVNVSLGAVYDTLISSSNFYTGVCGDVKGRVFSPLALKLTGCFDFYRQGYLYWNPVPLPGQPEISLVTEKRLFVEGIMEFIAKVNRRYEFFFPLGYAFFRFWNGAFDDYFQGPTGGVGFRIKKRVHLIEINPVKVSLGVGGDETSSLAGGVRFSIDYSLIYRRKLNSISLLLGVEGKSFFYDAGERHYEKLSLGVSF